MHSAALSGHTWYQLYYTHSYILRHRPPQSLLKRHLDPESQFPRRSVSTLFRMAATCLRSLLAKYQSIVRCSPSMINRTSGFQPSNHFASELSATQLSGPVDIYGHPGQQVSIIVVDHIILHNAVRTPLRPSKAYIEDICFLVVVYLRPSRDRKQLWQGSIQEPLSDHAILTAHLPFPCSITSWTQRTTSPAMATASSYSSGVTGSKRPG